MGTFVRWALSLVAAVMLVTAVSGCGEEKPVPGEPTMVVAGATFDLRVARTASELERGLSGTASLAPDEAMLFVLPARGSAGVWMKDMAYPIDIMWLDDRMSVVDVLRSAQPSSYPKTIYTPSSPSTFVVEMADGTVARHGITPGMRVQVEGAGL